MTDHQIRGDLICMTASQRDELITKASRTATLKAYDELGKILNSRIAKMEILDANNPTPLRKGILLAYRDIEEWERQQRKSLRTAAQEARR
jgi:hypothetical protein